MKTAGREALAEAMSVAALATTADIAGVKGEIVAVRAEPKADIELLRRDLTIRLGSMMLVAVGILLTGIRYLPPPH
jgi:hypothetical protein